MSKYAALVEFEYWHMDHSPGRKNVIMDLDGTETVEQVIDAARNAFVDWGKPRIIETGHVISITIDEKILPPFEG